MNRHCRRAGSKLLALTMVLALGAGLAGCPRRRERAEAELHRGQALLQLQDNTLARQAFQQAVRLDPDLAPAYDGLGISSCRLGRLEEARSAFSRAQALDPTNPGYPFSLGICETSQGAQGLSPALLAFERAGRLDPKNAGIQLEIGSTLQNLGRHREAIAYLQRAIELDPKLFAAYNNLGVSLSTLGEFDRAVELYQQAIKLHPELAGLSLYSNLGIAFLYQNNLPRAESAFTLETAINPDHLPAHLNLGNIYATQSRFPEAVREYQRVLSLEPQNRRARINLAIVYISEKEPAEAQKILLELLREFPDDPAGHFYLGQTYSLQGDRTRANSEFQRAQTLGFKLEPPSPTAKP